MANYLELDTGRIKEKAGTVDANTAGAIVALDGTGRIDNAIMPTGIGADTKVVTNAANESFSAGDLVNIFDSTGTCARKADASTEGKEAVGFVISSVTAGNPATVYFEGTITGLTGLTVGSRQYLDTTSAGGTTETAPSTTSNVVQFIGIALSATEISFEPGEPITVA